jgi:hypothetical protein
MTIKYVLCAAALTLGIAGMMGSAADAQPKPVTGYLIDVMCGTKHAPEGATFGAKHDKSCLLMEACVKSGYSVLTADNKILKFDAKGSELALALIKNTNRESDWRVSVDGAVTNDTIAVTGLRLE